MQWRIAFAGLLLAGTLWAAETNLVEVLHRFMEGLDRASATGGVAGLAGPRAVSSAEEILRPQDVIQIVVADEPELSVSRARVSTNGVVDHPILGPLPLGGKTPGEASNFVHGILARDYLVRPRLQLTVVELARWSATLAGQVVQPGTFFWRAGEPVTLQRAIDQAGGPLRPGALASVRVIRTVDGARQTLTLDLLSPQTAPGARGFLVQPGDMIELGVKPR